MHHVILWWKWIIAWLLRLIFHAIKNVLELWIPSHILYLNLVIMHTLTIWTMPVSVNHVLQVVRNNSQAFASIMKYRWLCSIILIFNKTVIQFFALVNLILNYLSVFCFVLLLLVMERGVLVEVLYMVLGQVVAFHNNWFLYVHADRRAFLKLTLAYFISLLGRLFLNRLSRVERAVLCWVFITICVISTYYFLPQVHAF